MHLTWKQFHHQMDMDMNLQNLYQCMEGTFPLSLKSSPHATAVHRCVLNN